MNQPIEKAQRIPAWKVAQDEGYRSVEALCNDITFGTRHSVACCEQCCEVEPDGYCEHGNPSILIQLGAL
jgi:hypothetical protein